MSLVHRVIGSRARNDKLGEREKKITRQNQTFQVADTANVGLKLHTHIGLLRLHTHWVAKAPHTVSC